MKNLTLTDFISDYQHLIVQGVDKDVILKHIELHYSNIKNKCLDYIRYKP